MHHMLTEAMAQLLCQVPLQVKLIRSWPLASLALGCCTGGNPGFCFTNSVFGLGIEGKVVYERIEQVWNQPATSTRWFVNFVMHVLS